jgi:hypothetical protein
MSRATSKFRQSDVERVVKATLAAGIKVGSVRVMPDGAIEIIAENTSRLTEPSANEWDCVQ